MERTCNLIVDSCCDLPFEAVDRPGVSLIRFPFLFESAPREDDLYQSLDPHEFFEAMRTLGERGAEAPSTSQIPPHVFEEAFSRAIESGLPSVYLSFSSALSGSCDVACMVRDDLLARNPGAELHVVDTRLASIAEGLLVLEAINQLEKGMGAAELAAWAEEARYFVNAQFMVDDLSALRRGGRIPASVALAGAKLDVKPLLGIDLGGKLTLLGAARGRKKGMRQLAEFYSRNVDREAPSMRVLVADSDCPKDAARLKEEIAKAEPSSLVLDSRIGPVIGSHVGPGMLAVVFWGADRREEASVAERIARRVRER